MKIYLFTLPLTICFSTIFGQSLNEKIEQLGKIKAELNEKIELIEQTEQRKQETRESLERYLSEQEIIEAKIKQLEKTKKNAKSEYENTKNSLSSTRKTLQATRNYAEVVDMVCQEEYKLLFELHFKSVLYPENIADCKLLAYMLNESLQESSKINKELSELLSTKHRLETKKKKDEKYYLDVSWSEVVNRKKDKEYAHIVKEMEENLAQIEREYNDFLDSKQQLEKEAKALDRLIAKLQSDIIEEEYSYQFSSEKLNWPAEGKVIRYFGEQQSEEYNVTVFNNGIDIELEKGTEIKTVDDGIVAFAERHGGSGKLVIINHKNGFYTLYGHNSVLLVSKGEEVFKGQPISLSGSTGNADEPCLHFEVRKKGKPMDPMEFLK
ncbi:MAG: peptidoglycan DD-metalloendopeptidase family protein [Candidatus Cloacimonadota bacterium]|nr:peptidoglycan DD-metalloendopeptidase family protein [Candidatus Cloacimonadota bacterium]